MTMKKRKIVAKYLLACFIIFYVIKRIIKQGDTRSRIKKTLLLSEQVLSLYMCQLEDIEGFRLNDYDYGDELLLTGISYHPDGFDKITIESLDSELKGIEEISSTTNFSFHINNKDYLVIEANRLVFWGKVYQDLIAPENELKWEDES